MGSEYVEKIHTEFNVPQEAVFELIRRNTAFSPCSAVKIVKGYENEVYSIDTGEGEGLIARISRRGEVGFGQEVWAMEQCAKAEVPVPEVYWVGFVETQQEMLEVMVESRLSGKPLADWFPALSLERLDHVLYQAGEMLARIHSIPVQGFWRRQENGTWDFPSWEKIMESVIIDRSREKALILGDSFDEDDFAFMIRMLQVYQEGYPCRKPVLCHGDYVPEHIFIDSNLNITGIIDFGMLQGGPRILDIAYLAFERPDLNLEGFLKGYGSERFWTDFEVELNLQKLALQMGHLAHQTRIEDWEQAAFTRKQLRRTLDILSRHFG